MFKKISEFLLLFCMLISLVGCENYVDSVPAAASVESSSTPKSSSAAPSPASVASSQPIYTPPPSSSEPVYVEVEGIEVGSASTVTLEKGGTSRIKATPVPNDIGLEDCKITYSTDNPAVATVSPDGIITYIDEGTAKIMLASVNGKTALVNVTCKAVAPPTSSSSTLASKSHDKQEETPESKATNKTPATIIDVGEVTDGYFDVVSYGNIDCRQAFEAYIPTQQSNVPQRNITYVVSNPNIVEVALDEWSSDSYVIDHISWKSAGFTEVALYKDGVKVAVVGINCLPINKPLEIPNTHDSRLHQTGVGVALSAYYNDGHQNFWAEVDEAVAGSGLYRPGNGYMFANTANPSQSNILLTPNEGGEWELTIFYWRGTPEEMGSSIVLNGTLQILKYFLGKENGETLWSFLDANFTKQNPNLADFGITDNGGTSKIGTFTFPDGIVSSYDQTQLPRSMVIGLTY